jgi:hypothetical protein
MLIYIEHPERPFKLHVFIGVDPTDISKRFNKYKKKKFYFPKGYFVPEHGEDEALTYDLGDALPGHFCIQFFEVPKMGTLAHEVFHVVSMHMRYVSIPLNESTEETYAYMFSWLIDKITDEIKKQFKV